MDKTDAYYQKANIRMEIVAEALYEESISRLPFSSARIPWLELSDGYRQAWRWQALKVLDASVVHGKDKAPC